MSFGGSGGGGGAVYSSSDVALNSPAQGQVLGYDTSIQKWQNMARPLPMTESVVTVASSGASRTISDTSSATISTITLTANCTFTFPAAAAGKSFMLVLKQDGTGNRTITWPGTVMWPGDTNPTLTTAASKIDVFSFICVDGTNWLGFTAGKAY